MSSRKIDGSADAVYSVENETMLLLRAMDEIGVCIHNAYGSSFVMPTERTFLELSSVERYVNELNGNPKYRRMASKPVPYINVKESRYADRSSWNGTSIHLADPPWYESGYRQMTILHEFAHYLGGNGHGDRFRAAYMILIADEMSPELARYLQIRLYEETQEVERLKKQGG